MIHNIFVHLALMKKIISGILVTIWRIWFILLAMVPILVFLPIIVISILREKWFPYFFKIARAWSHVIFYGMGFHFKKEIKQAIDPNKSYMFIGNHSSMMDIMLMLILVKNPFIFVGKKELGKIPIFGFIYKRTAILVDRSSPASRKAVYDNANRRIKNGTSICIFPEGGVPDRSVLLADFKKGAFRLAIEHQIPIVPITFCGLKEFFPFEWWYGKPAKIKVTIHKHIEVDSLTLENVNDLTKSSWNTIHEALLSCK